MGGWMPDGNENKQNAPLTKAALEGLSTGELIKLADGWGIDIPQSLERVFIIGELLEAAADIEGEQGSSAAEDDIKGADSQAAAVIPKHYNISFIEVVMRDPFWVFAFWEIKEQTRQQYEGAPGFQGYCLRVIRLNGGAGDENAEDSFDIAIGALDTARYLGLPQDTADAGGGVQAERRYVVKLCAVQNGREIQIASSPPFVMASPAAEGGLGAGPCSELSGYSDFSIARRSLRPSREKREK